MTSEVEGGDALPSSAAGPPAGVRTAALSPVMRMLWGKWPAAGLAEKKGASSRREVPAPTSFFGSVQRVFSFFFFCMLEKEMQAFAPSWFRITSYIWPSCRAALVLWCQNGLLYTFRSWDSEGEANCKLFVSPRVASCKHLKRMDRRERAYTQGHIRLVWEMVGTKYCTPIPWLSSPGLYSKTVLARLLVTLYNNVSHCPCLAEP